MSAYGPTNSSDSYEAQLKALEEGKAAQRKQAAEQPTSPPSLSSLQLTSQSSAYSFSKKDEAIESSVPAKPSSSKASSSSSSAAATTSLVLRYPLRVYILLLFLNLTFIILSIAILSTASIFKISGAVNGMTSSAYDCGFFWECDVATSTRICNTWSSPPSTLETAQAFAVLNTITLFGIFAMLLLLLKVKRQGLLLFLIGIFYIWDFICHILALQKMMDWGGSDATMIWGGGIHVLMIILIAPTFLFTFYLSAKGVDFENICGC